MVKINYNILIGCLIIAMGIVIHGYIIKSNNNLSCNNERENTSIIDLNNVFDITEAAEYLHITNSEVEAIIIIESKRLSETGSFLGTMLPYFQVDNEYYFHKEGLDRWLADVTTEKRKYDTIRNIMIR